MGQVGWVYSEEEEDWQALGSRIGSGDCVQSKRRKMHRQNEAERES